MAQSVTLSEYDFLYDLPRVDFVGRGLHYLPRIQYGRDHPRQFMECIYRDGDRDRPVLVWIHGGGWHDDNLTPAYRPEEALAALAEKGFFIACIEYRLAQHAPFPACVEDCQKAVRYLRQHAAELGICPDRIALWGESAGAHVAAMTALRFGDAPQADVAAAVLWFCPSDLSRQMESNSETDIVSRLIGCSARENPEAVRRASPVAYAGRGAGTPILLMHGDADELVSYDQSVAFCRELRAHGCPAELITVPGQGHGFFQGQSYYDAVLRFLEEHAGKERSV